jgi:glycine dehydrogenase subunit 2
MDLIFRKSRPGAANAYFPAKDAEGARPAAEILPRELARREPLRLPELSELEVVRHVLALCRRQVGVDSAFYPLGSCTMKYNPKFNESFARHSRFSALHPFQPCPTVQGTLELLYETERLLAEITGMDEVTLNPFAGAHGEYAGILLIKAWHRSRGEERRNVILVPASAHGTNPASAAMAGYQVVTVPCTPEGLVDLAGLQAALSDDVAALMLTNPNTLGIFEKDILTIAERVHSAGGLLYYDGANLNAILGIARPGDMGFDVVHVNVHKTFSTPHGGGGPGAGPVGVKAPLRDFLPVPYVRRREEDGRAAYELSCDRPRSIGRFGAFQGNVGILLRAYAYLRALGREGLPRVARHAVLNAAYLLARLSKSYRRAGPEKCMHEFVIQPTEQMLAKGIRALHLAKRLMDYGFHPPTIYFPLVVKEAMMVEPTETESLATLDAFADAMEKIAAEALNAPDLVLNAPLNSPVSRVDETKAARDLDLRFPPL